MPPAYEVLLLNTAIPQIQAAQSGDTYVVPRDIAFSTVASFAAGAEATPSIVATGDTNTGIWFPAADTVAISTGGTSRLRLDSSGNLGLGVTPSAWSGTAIQVKDNGPSGRSSSLASAGGDLQLSNNAFYNGSNWLYQASAFATNYYQSNGTHVWRIAPSGTAGNTISFTQAMTLDASGNLGVGLTNPAARSGGGGGVVDANGPVLARGALNADQTNAGVLQYASNETRIRSYGATAGTGFMTFTTGGGGGSGDTERARITSGGNFLVNTVNSGRTDSNSITLEPNVSGGGYAVFNHLTGSSSGRQFISFAYAGTEIGSITQNGTTGVLYNITSDYRLKDVVNAVTGAGARIDALKPVNYTWKADGSAARGFLAHEFQEVYPNSVTGTKDAVDEEGKPVYQNMQASTSEVIADLVAEIQSLRARVKALEGA